MDINGAHQSRSTPPVARLEIVDRDRKTPLHPTPRTFKINFWFLPISDGYDNCGHHSRASISEIGHSGHPGYVKNNSVDLPSLPSFVEHRTRRVVAR